MATPARIAASDIFPPEPRDEKVTVDRKGSYSSSTSEDSLGLGDGLGDGIEDGMLPPTEEERKTLRRVTGPIPWKAFVIAFLELCERASYYGLSGPLVNYIQRPLPHGSDGGQIVADGQRPGVLGRGQQVAFAITTFNSFWSYFTPIVGAYIADKYLGRYNAISWGTALKIVAQIIITSTASPAGIRAGAAFPGLVVGIVLLGMGTGIIKSNVSPLIADQVKTRRQYVKGLPSGERVIVDSNATMQRVFSTFYWAINIGACLKVATTTLEKEVGFWASFLLPTALACLMPVVLVAGNSWFIKVPPRGSIVGETFRVVRVVFGKAASANPIRFVSNLRHGMLDPSSGAIISVWEFAKPTAYKRSVSGTGKEGEDEVPKWLTWDAAFVDEVKRTMKACLIFTYYPLYWLPYSQMTNNLVSQASVLTLGGVPNDLLSAFDPITIVIIIPIMDRLVYPTLRKLRIPFHPVSRIFCGFMFATAAMVYAAVLQSKVYKLSPCMASGGKSCDPVSISVWVQLPVYILIAISEIFANITGLQLAYQKAPARMKSVVTSIYLFTNCISSALGFCFTSVSVDPYLTGLYSGIGGAAFVAGVLFLVTFRSWNATEEEENEVGNGKRMEE